MPRACAFSFICRRNSSSLPATYSAKATAASLALATTVALSMSSTDMASPSLSQMSDPPIDAAWALAVTVSVRAILPASNASITSSSVITLVIEAQARFSCGFFSYNTFPVCASIRTAAGALTSSSESADAARIGTDIPISRTASSPAAIRLPFICNLPPRSAPGAEAAAIALGARESKPSNGLVRSSLILMPLSAGLSQFHPIKNKKFLCGTAVKQPSRTGTIKPGNITGARRFHARQDTLSDPGW